MSLLFNFSELVTAVSDSTHFVNSSKGNVPVTNFESWTKERVKDGNNEVKGLIYIHTEGMRMR